MAGYRNPTVNEILNPSQVEDVAPSRYANPSLESITGEKKVQKPTYEWGSQPPLKIGFPGFEYDTGRVLTPTGEKVLGGIGHSFANVGRSARQLSGDYSPEEATRDAMLDAPLMDTGWGQTGDIIGQVGMSAAIPMGGLARGAGWGAAKLGATGLGTKLGSSVLADAMMQGGVQSLLRPTLEDETRLGNVLKGASISGAFTAASKPVLGLVGKGINAVRNKWANALDQQLDEIAQRNGVNLSAGDFAGNQGWRHFENATEGIPGTGRTKNLEREAGEIQDMLYSLRENFRPSLEVVDANGQKLANYANTDDMMVGEIQRNFKALTAQKDELFQNVSDVIAKTPNATKVKLMNTRNEVKRLIDEHPDVFDKFRDIDSPLLNKLKGLDDNLSIATGVLNLQGQPYKRTAQSTYDEAQWLRKRLGSLANTVSKAAKVGSASDDAAGQIKQVYKAVNADLDNWGASATNKPIHDAYKTAQDFYKNNLVPFKTNKTLSKVVNEHVPFDPDLATKEFFKDGRGNAAEALMRFMTPEGQRAAQFTLIDNIVEKGVANQDGNITQALNFIKKMKDPANAVLSPVAKQSVDDAEKILTAGSRAQNFKDVGGSASRIMAMQTTRSIAPWLLGTGGVAAAGSAGGLPAGLAAAGLLGAVVGGSKAANSMSRNPAGKRLLLSDPNLPGGLQEMADFLVTKASGPYGQHKLGDGTIGKYVDYISEQADPGAMQE